MGEKCKRKGSIITERELGGMETGWNKKQGDLVSSFSFSQHCTRKCDVAVRSRCNGQKGDIGK